MCRISLAYLICAYVLGAKRNLSVKWVVVKQVGAVELLAVGLGHTDDVLISLEYLNLGSVLT